MLLLCSSTLLHAQEQNTPLTSFVSNQLAHLSGPAAYTGTDVPEKAPAKKTVTLMQRRSYYRLGERLVTLNRQVTDESTAYVFVSLHNNETTIAEAARRSIVNNGGTLLELLNDNQRDIEFTLFEKNLSVDPNNIFTPKGRNRELSASSKTDVTISRQLNGFSQFILDEIPHEKTIVSVHSNDDGDQLVTDYARNGEHDNDAAQVYVNADQNANDFFVTTDRSVFNKIKEKKYNVVLLSLRSRDDGSLAVYCSRMHRNYVGIETERGHEAQQESMVAVISELLR